MKMVNVLALIVSSTLVYSAPLIFTTLGGVFSERSGIVNVGLEGIMVIGAFSSIVFNLAFAQQFGNMTPWIAMIFAGVCGLVFALIHAVATVNFRADHIISGTVLNLIAPALGVFLTRVLFEGDGQTDIIRRAFGKFNFPVLADIPVIGPIFFKATSLPAYVGIALAVVVWVVIYKTRFGLRLRSVGEHPQAADTLGIDVYKLRYAGVLLSGFFGGMGGAVLAQSVALNFSVATVAGQGFIAMAAMIFGKWNPIGAMGAALFFGFAQSLAVVGSSIPFIKSIPPVYLQIAPYVITIVVLIGFVGRSKAPAAVGTTYIKTK
ncbi:ABC transporter permease [Aerococcaceae bacterium NML191292]|nr:ABC transporter permease [Aerococcaceae bacterium NML191292]MCW6663415.1 ABC transporter permease [Aerococcaceae bacterium NML190073]MCW6675301.1 ABC transporter permease [Aerococcaceae bacterium NML171108]MCW6677205.1 ABC transporter permease [Aerococcaceae bacterium NML180378]MCW6680637.1 ABC transporter permease [Aerococcaceae bacterium NML130460]